MCLRFQTDTGGGIELNSQEAWQCVERMTTEWMVSLSQKHRHGKDTKDRSMSLLMHNFITHWQMKPWKRR